MRTGQAGNRQDAIGFPLEPFLASLAADGIRLSPRDYDRIALALRAWPGGWTGDRIADVLCPLLATSSETDEMLRRRCADFFRLPLEAESRFDGIDVPRALQELTTVGKGTPGGEPGRLGVSDGCASGEDTPESGGKDDEGGVRLERTGYISGMRAYGRNLNEIMYTAREDISLIFLMKPRLAIFILLSSSVSLIIFMACVSWYLKEEFAKFVSDIFGINIESDTAKFFAVIAIAFTFAIYGNFYKYIHGKIRKISARLAIKMARRPSQSLYVTDDAENCLSSPTDHCPPNPRLGAAGIDALADGIGRFTSAAVSQVLDVPGTVRASTRAGGVPDLCFRLHRRDRQVVVLEDRSAESLAWNHAAAELADGLEKRGIRVLRGWFRGTPVACHHEDGRDLHLDELEDSRDGHLILLLSDSQGLRAAHRPLLEDLARWPCVAWLELRDSQLWDEGTALAANAGLPVLPASDAGLEQLARLHLSERGGARPTPAPAVARAAFLDPYSPALCARMDYLLGDALSWAQDCAMVQPIGFGLADELRRAFHGGVPPERIDRLLALPGTERSAGGLIFAQPVLAVLAEGFATMRDAQEQERVLDFIEEAIRRTEPPRPPEGSTTIPHLTWRWTMARIRLERDPDATAEELKRLSATPLLDSMKDTLECRTIRRDAHDGEGRIPLRRAPRSAWTRKLLTSLTGETDRHPLRQRIQDRLAKRGARLLMRCAAVPLLAEVAELYVRWYKRDFVGSRVGWEVVKELSKGLQCQFSPDGKYFAAANGPAVQIYAPGTGRMVHRFRHTHVVRWLSFSPNGDKLACGSEAGKLSIWSLANGNVLEEFEGMGRAFMPFTWKNDDCVAYFGDNGASLTNNDRILTFGYENTEVTCMATSTEDIVIFLRSSKRFLWACGQSHFFAKSLRGIPDMPIEISGTANVFVFGVKLDRCLQLFTFANSIRGNDWRMSGLLGVDVEMVKPAIYHNILDYLRITSDRGVAGSIFFGILSSVMYPILCLFFLFPILTPRMRIRDARWRLDSDDMLVTGPTVRGEKFAAARSQGVWSFHCPTRVPHDAAH